MGSANQGKLGRRMGLMRTAPGLPGRRQAEAFTLVELLVVVAILMLLLTLLLPSLQKAREAARSAACRNNARGLVHASQEYANMFRCLPPAGYRPSGGEGGPDWFWYQKVCLGRFFEEDVPMYASVNGLAPPAKSVLRCPSQAAWDGLPATASWIGYNSGMCYEFGPTGTDQLCYFRGPKLEEIFTPADRLVLFQDARGCGFLYLCRWANNDRALSFAAGNVRVDELEYNGWPYNTCDFRHDGGVNYGFVDGHAAYFANPDAAYGQHRIESQIR